jgi:putative ABC transport system permease protein
LTVIVLERDVGGLLQDLKYSIRVLAKTPGLTAFAVVTLALGLGATTAIFSVVDGVLLRPLPFPQSSRLLAVCETNSQTEGFCVASPPDVEDWRAQARTLEAVGIGRDWPFTLADASGRRGVAGGLATPGFFQALAPTPALGRLFLPNDLTPEGNHVALLSHGFWTTEFGADPKVLGRTITLDHESYAVIGVLPEDAQVPLLEYVRLWIPLPFSPTLERNRKWRGFKTVARLAPGATREQAVNELTAISGRLAERYPTTNKGWGIAAQPLQDQLVGSVRGTLLLFLGAVGFVLLIGCANVANLLLARAARRRREMAVRAAMGAGRGSLVRLALAESFTLAGAGLGLGLLLAFWGTDAFIALAPPGIPRLNEVRVDGVVLAFAAVAFCVTAVLSGLPAALKAGRIDLTVELKNGQRDTLSRKLGGARSLLVVSETGLAVALLVGAGLLIRSFVTLVRWDPGFDKANLVTFWTLTSHGTYPKTDQLIPLYDNLLDELRTLPGVQSASTASAGPMFGGTETGQIAIEGQPAPSADQRPVARWFDVGNTYFQTMGIPFRQGRPFDDGDRRGGRLVAIVNETMARRFWPGASAIGQRVTLLEQGTTFEIVGVVADVPPWKKGTAVTPELYWPFRQFPRWATYVVLRTTADPTTVMRAARERLVRVAPDVDLSPFNTMNALVGERLVRPRFSMTLLGMLAGVALLLAAIGTAGVLAWLVAARTREMAIRMALGATSMEILGAVLREGMRLTLIGVAIGLAGALALARSLSALLVGVAPSDPVTFVAAALTLVLVAALACYIPGRRAAGIDPAVALRQE